jgi:hypothetical protein
MLRAAAVSVLLSVATAQGWVDRTPTNPLTGPSNRAFSAMCWDAAHGYVLMFGGVPGINGTAAANETWSWNGTAWTRRFTNQSPTSSWNVQQPCQTAMAFHPPTNEVVMVHAGSTWTWTGSDWLYRNVPIGSNGPGEPRNVALAHDPVRNHTVLFVGTRYWSNGNPVAVSETFLWDGFGWSQRQTPVIPWPVENPAMAFDPVANRLVLATSGTPAGAFYEWTGSNWQQRLPAGAPMALGALATDTAHQQIVMLDGVLNAQPNHTWTLANGTLQQVSTAIEPARRFGAAMAYDPIRGKVVMFGGTNIWNWSNNLWFSLGDTWEFELGAGASYTAFGAGCAGSRGVPTLAAATGSTPRIGQTFQANVGNLPWTGPVFLFVGLSDTTYGPTPLPFNLGGLGAPGCSVLSSGEDLALLTNVLGNALWQWTIPNAPGVSFYNQAFAFDPAANALGITTSNAAHGTIGF